MVDEYRILQDALNTLRYAQSLKRKNQELYDHLCGSIIYLIKYSKKYNLPLPNVEGLRSLVVRSHDYIDSIREMQRPPTESQQHQLTDQQRKETPDKDNNTINWVLSA